MLTQISHYLPELQDVAVKFACAVVLAGVLGIERERRGRAAGIRTHILVCLGATLTMIISERIADDLAQRDIPVWLDKGRIAAGVLTGVGFLGAGTIVTVRHTHQGLTTAAMVWFVAALGIAIGLGEYVIALCATTFALLTVNLLRFLAPLVLAHGAMTLDVQVRGSLSIVDEMEDLLRSLGYRVSAVRLRSSHDEDRIDITFELNARRRPDLDGLVRALQERFSSLQRVTLER